LIISTLLKCENPSVVLLSHIGFYTYFYWLLFPSIIVFNQVLFCSVHNLSNRQHYYDALVPV